MGIKYHQYGCGNDYGDDHYLTDNWNPDYDYGSQYVEVYFNINTPSYMHDKDPSAFGFASDEARDEWYAAASKVIASFDILEDSGYNVENSAEKRAYLYPHPQQISGVILKNDVRKVAEAIERMSPSSIRWVDLYDTVYVISDEAYEKYLIFKDESLKKDLFEVCQTLRITRFYDAIEISRSLAMKYRLKRLGINDGRNYGSGQTIDHIMRLMQKMSEDGLLVMTSPSGEETYVRSLNKTELKKWIRSHMMLIEQFMNIGTLTENECKNCWAFLLCSSCGVSCTGSDGFCAKKRLKKCGGIQQYVIKILRSIKILEENGYDFYRFEKNVEE